MAARILRLRWGRKLVQREHGGHSRARGEGAAAHQRLQAGKSGQHAQDSLTKQGSTLRSFPWDQKEPDHKHKEPRRGQRYCKLGRGFPHHKAEIRSESLRLTEAWGRWQWPVPLRNSRRGCQEVAHPWWFRARGRRAGSQGAVCKGLPHWLGRGLD